MDDALRTTLHDVALEARALLTEETRMLLGAVYGLSPDGRLEPPSNLPALAALPEAAETRQRLEQYLHNEAGAGRDAAEAMQRLLRETAFTHLNRLVALKLLEARRLIRGTLDRYHDSNGFQFYRLDHPEDDARYLAGDLPQNALGEGPRDLAYRHFLLWQFGQLSQEVPVLFDSANLPSRLFPRPRTLRTLVERLNADDLRAAWAPGNEESIGWIYQYFNSEELQKAFQEVRLSGKKFERADIPSVTQLFTPRWIVRFLVENTLGRHWLQMHPDSRLADELPYLVPPAQPLPPLPSKPVRELTLLDPACGTMHFGLVAFDLFVAMYREELERAGEPGWPAAPSVAQAEDIPAAILEHNLFGIDIDLRAVQLAALSLYLRAKTLNPKARIMPRNLACADISVLNGKRLSAFVEGLERPLAAAIRALWPLLAQAGEFGSLLRLEQNLRDQLVEQRPDRRTKGMQPLPGLEQPSAGRFTLLQDLDGRVRAALNAFARQEAAQNHDATAFVAGATQGLVLLDLLARRYEVVVANPPYLSVRKMNGRLKDFVADAYPAGKMDLYAAFIQRCLELCADHGRVGMLTMHSFMFISSYAALRRHLRDQAAIEQLLHLGPALFEVGNPGTLQTAAYVLRREPEITQRVAATGIYLRLVKEKAGDAKRTRFEQAATTLASGARDQIEYRYHQADFDAIEDAPWVYWVPAPVRRLFAALPALESVAPPRQGTATADNTRFLRFWWEVGRLRIVENCSSMDESLIRRERWYPYMKGGTFRRWYGNQEHIVNWFNGGKEIASFKPKSVIRNPNYYFQTGVTWSDLTSGRFSARLSPGGFIFDVKGSSAFPREEDIPLVLALLNSEFAHYALNLLNPTVSFQVGDLARLPIPTQSSDTLRGLVERAIELAKQDSIESETTYDFVAPPPWPDGVEQVAARRAGLAVVERAIDEEVYRLYGITGAGRAAIEAELAEAPLLAEEAGEEARADEDDTPEQEERGALNRRVLAQRWLGYALGIVLGRFQPGLDAGLGAGRFDQATAAALRELADPDGIGLIAPGQPDDLCARLTRALELIAGEEQAHAILAGATGGSPLDEYLPGDFYKAHVQQYRKRPVYWLFQSPQRRYSLLLFHERLTGDSLSLILGNQYVQRRINELRSQHDLLSRQADALPNGRERSRAMRSRDKLAEQQDDVEQFAARLRDAINAQNQRGEPVGWRPEIDDGVLINLAPLHKLIPAWSAEPKACWQALANGDYDWSHTAMRYWPDRVLEECRTNRSFAIAHGFEPPDAPAPATPASRRGRPKSQKA